jgi:hypothetical protein
VSDETVFPSSLLQFAESEYYSANKRSFANFGLKFGMVKERYDIEDKNNISKLGPEYDVMVLEQEGDKGISPLTYKNCIALDSFGGIADFSEFTKIQPANKNIDNVSKDDGSIVLILCIDGTVERGVIVGAVSHHRRKQLSIKDKKSNNQEWNGIRINIDDDGALTLTMKGKTDNLGKPTKPIGSQFKMEKDGSVELNDRDLDPILAGGNDKEAKPVGDAPKDKYEKLRIDKTKQTFDLFSRKDMGQATDANYNLTVKEVTTLKTKDWIAMAEGKANFAIKGTFDIKADGAMSMTAADMKFKSDAAFDLQAQAVKITAQSVAVGPGGTPAIIGSTQFLGIGNLGAPVISTAIGPFSSVVLIAP